MYIYCTLINALSTHIIHVDLNMIFYTHVDHSPVKNNLHTNIKHKLSKSLQYCPFKKL